MPILDGVVLEIFYSCLGHGYRISSATTPKEVSPVLRLENANYGVFGQALDITLQPILCYLPTHFFEEPRNFLFSLN